MAINPISNLATFPVYLHLGPYHLHPHIFFEAISYFIGFCVYFSLRRRFGDAVASPLRWAVVAAAVAGAAFGSKLLYWLEDPRLTWTNLHNPAFLMDGKTIVGALIGGLVTVKLVKRSIGLRISTGDLYAIPLALGIAIGRIGCFLTGLSDHTYGTRTSLPWGIDFGDSVRRHPTQLYEIAFLLALIPLLYKVLQRIAVHARLIPTHNVVLSAAKDPCSSHTAPDREPERRKPGGELFPGDAFKLFMIAYSTFRLLVDFIKPYPRLFLGLGGIQWACVVILLYYSPDIARWISANRTLKLLPA